MSQIIDCVIVSSEPYTDLGRLDWTLGDCREFCGDVNLFAFRLTHLGFRDDEMPRSLIHVCRVTELVIRTEPLDDILDFFTHIKWSPALVEETINALEEIGADAYARFLAALHVYLKGIRYKPMTRFRGDEIDKEHAAEFGKVIKRATEDLSEDILEIWRNAIEISVATAIGNDACTRFACML